jgi:hypothetical protein
LQLQAHNQQLIFMKCPELNKIPDWSLEELME